MNSLILHFVFIFLAISLAMIWAKSSSRSRASYFDGAEWWSRALPTVCCFLYIFILGANIIGFNPKIINISHSFNLPEMIVLFTAGALFFSHYSKHISLFISGYLFFVRVFFVSSLTTQVDVADIYFLLSLTSIVFLLGHNMPWAKYNSSIHHRKVSSLNEFSIVIISISALMVLIFSLLSGAQFRFWLYQAGLVSLNEYEFGCVLLVSLIGWIFTALNIWRTYLIPLLTLPTLVALAFVAGTGYAALMPALAVFVGLFLLGTPTSNP